MNNEVSGVLGAPVPIAKAADPSAFEQSGQTKVERRTITI